MKKQLGILFLLITGFSAAFAQDLKPFKVGIGLGYAAPATTGAGAGGGVLFYVEPGYRASDNVLIGLRLESAVIARGIKGVGDDDVSGDASSNVSYTLNGQYYFNDNYVRPFVGAGFGLFSLAAVKFNTASPNNSVDANEVGAETRFGFYPRIGLDAGHFNFSIDYNIVPKTDVPNIGEVKNNYLGIRAGVAIGGGVGRKKNG
jgi:outer membrane protein X